MSREEYCTFDAARAEVKSFLNRHSFRLARDAVGKYLELHRGYERSLSERPSYELQGVVADMVFDLETRLALALEAVRLFLNHTEAHLIGRYGRDSDERRRWTDATGALFDGHFSYRFLYGLRNCLHKQLPPSNVRIDQWEPCPGERASSLSVLLSPQELLNVYDRWHATVKHDLRAMTDEFPIHPLVEELDEHIGHLVVAAMEIDLPKAAEAADILRSLADEVAGPGFLPAVIATDLAPDGLALQMRLQLIPLESVELVHAAGQGSFTLFGPASPSPGN